MRKSIITLVLFLCFYLSPYAQQEVIYGTLTKKPWSKTIESYCAGGSDYYVLREKDNHEIILDLSAWKQSRIDKLVNQRIGLRGKWNSFVKKNPDPMAQQPVQAPDCRLFVVKRQVRLKKGK